MKKIITITVMMWHTAIKKRGESRVFYLEEAETHLEQFFQIANVFFLK